MPDPSTPITPLITEITEMQNAFKQPSCLSREPMVKYPSVGTPPVLSFNVPQNTAFTTYGYLLKYFPVEYFKAFATKIPENNFFNTMKNMTTEQLNELFGYEYTTYQPYDAVAPGYTSDAAPGNASSPTDIAKAMVSGTAKVLPTAGPTVGGGISRDKLPSKYAPIVLHPIKHKGYYNDLRPYDRAILNGIGNITRYIAQPPRPVPRIITIEEYTTVSYLGQYGAGRIVKTFSLYPGEQTTISMRTYKDKVTTVESSKNVIDSFSESSATALDTLMQEEQGMAEAWSHSAGGSGSAFSTTTDTRNSSRSSGISGSLSLFGAISIGGGMGRSASEMSTSSGGMSSTYDYNDTAARQSNINTLSSALNKHVQQSNSQRQIDINNSTSDTTKTGEENVTVRALKNVNLNNVLNITARQLLQEYTVITYLSGLKFAYTNGYPESYTVVDILGLENMLIDLLDTVANPGVVDTVLCKLLSPYCNVLNYEDDYKQFVEKKDITNADCLGLVGCVFDQSRIYRVNKLCTDTYTDGVINVEVHGVILNVQKQTLQTSSLIMDALLGRGDALDCFNQKNQDAANIDNYVNAMQGMQRLGDSIQTTANNQLFADQQLDMGAKQIDVVDQQMDIVTGIADANDKATLYKKVFGDCCDVPQSCCGGGCGCDCEDTPPAP